MDGIDVVHFVAPQFLSGQKSFFAVEEELLSHPQRFCSKAGVFLNIMYCKLILLESKTNIHELYTRIPNDHLKEMIGFV